MATTRVVAGGHEGNGGHGGRGVRMRWGGDLGCEGETKRARGKDWREWGGRASGRGARGVALILSRQGRRGGWVAPRRPVDQTVGGGRRQGRGSGPHGLLGLARRVRPRMGGSGAFSLSLPFSFLLLFSFYRKNDMQYLSCQKEF